MDNELIVNYASKGTRFGNNFIDTIGFYLIIFLNALVLDGWLGIMPEGGSDWFVLYFFILYVFYHFIFEYACGKTPGKFITGTKVIDSSGNRPEFKTLLIRNLCRLIPFDALSFLLSERGWHDSISKTYVVNK